MLHSQEQASGEQIIAHEHGNFIFPKRVDGEESSALEAIIDHIVMHQSGGVKQFYERGSAVGSDVDITEKFG